MVRKIGPSRVTVEVFSLGVAPRGVAHALVGGEDSSYKAEIVVRGGDLSCEVDTYHTRRRFVGRGPSSGELVGDVPDWSGTGRLYQ
jgi:hypothetical protein